MKRIIINADDFGLCSCVNEGIVRAHREGVLSSATIMANMPGFAEAVALARDNPALGVGVHLNLLRGLPLSDPSKIAPLLGPDGRFLVSPRLLFGRIVSGKAKREVLERELRAQIEKVLRAGIVPSHLDSEKHMHAFPPVFQAVIDLAVDYGIKKVRFIREFGLSRHISQSAKAVFLSLCCARVSARIRSAGLVIVDRFYGISNSGRMTAADLRRLIERPEEGSVEIMVHPGLARPELFALEALTGPYYINRFRESEWRAVTDPSVRALFDSPERRLISYHGL
jgi:hopanoid biosynthesis associated protein HpnK